MLIEFNRLYYQCLKYLIIIEQIKIKYKFRKDFDFQSWIIDLKDWSKLYKEHEELSIIRKMKDQFTNMVLAADNLISLVDNFLKQRDEFTNKLDPYKDESLNYSPKTGSTHEELHGLLGEFRELWQECENSIPEIGKGRPTNTHNKRCVNLLVMMFLNGSELEPSCYRSNIKKGNIWVAFMNL